MSDEGDDRIGSVVDERYKIVDAMASGSMGAVYKAERVPVGKIVAIKFLARLLHERQRVPGAVRARDARDEQARAPELRLGLGLRRVARTRRTS